MAMRRWIFLLILLGSFFAFSRKVDAKSAIVSPDGSFSLNGTDGHATKLLSRRLEGFEKQFYQLTGYSPGDIPPVVIVLHDAVDDLQSKVLLRVDSVEASVPKIQIDIPPGSISAAADTALAQAMILRQYYNGKSPAAGSRIAEFPAWFLHGLGKSCDPDAKLAVIPLSYLRGGTPPSVADLLIQKAPSDSNALLLDIYDTMAAELLRAGLEAREGDHSLRDWIGQFDFNAPNRAPSGWPPGWAMQSVERRWLLLMAGNSGEDSGVVSLLTVEATLARYDEILSEVSTPSHSLALLKKEKGAPYLVQQLLSRLVALRLQANPLANKLLDETITLCTQFKKLPEKKIASKEGALSSLRADTLKHSHSIEAYLDWFEAEKLPGKSGFFENLMNGSLDSSIQKGPIGRYLDTAEERGW